jgi:hypothetical protein
MRQADADHAKAGVAVPSSGCTAAAPPMARRLQLEAVLTSIRVVTAGDGEQLLRARKYDQALEQMLGTYQGKVFRMALTIVRDAGRAEELTQDVFLKLWRAFPAYDGRAAVSTWLAVSPLSCPPRCCPSTPRSPSARASASRA